MNTSAFGVEKGTLIRVPATANLMVDSANRPVILDASGISNISSPWDFSIVRQQPLINGFFTRVGTTEVVLEWCLDNISPTLQNNFFTVIDNSGVTVTCTMPSAAYTVYDALESVASRLNFQFQQQGRPNYNFAAAQFPSGQVYLGADSNFIIVPTKLSDQLSLTTPGYPTDNADLHFLTCPDLRPYRYLDFVCDQLTAVQDVKDASTAPLVRDVLCRWYFADDAPNQLDGFGFPILMGYTRFAQRRIFNPP